MTQLESTISTDEAPSAGTRQPGVAEPTSRLASLARAIIPPLLFGAFLIGVWYFISYVLLDPSRRFLLEPPHEVLKVGFLDWDNFSEILEKAWVTAKVALTGLIIAIIIGFTMAILMSQSKYIERAIFPYAVTLQAPRFSGAQCTIETLPGKPKNPLRMAKMGFGGHSKRVRRDSPHPAPDHSIQIRLWVHNIQGEIVSCDRV